MYRDRTVRTWPQRVSNPVIDILGHFRSRISDSSRLRQTRVFGLIMSAASQDDWIRVTSRDGFSFIVKRNVVSRSGTLRNMLDERRTSLHALPLIPDPHASTP